MKLKRRYIIEFTREEALALGLFTCTCGHPPNNHFEWGRMPCAFCKCTHYAETLRYGKFR